MTESANPYSMRDRITPLSANEFNRRFGDIDLRLRGLEALRTNWRDAIAEISDEGIRRINEVIRPLYEQLQTEAEISLDLIRTASDGILPDDSIDAAKLKVLAVTSAKLALGSVITDRLADGAVTTPKLADGAVTTDKLSAAVVYNPVTGTVDGAGHIYHNLLAGHAVITPAGGAATYDCALYNSAKLALDVNTSLNFINLPTTGASAFWLVVESNGHTLSFPSVRWESGNAPPLSSTDSTALVFLKPLAAAELHGSILIGEF